MNSTLLSAEIVTVVKTGLDSGESVTNIAEVVKNMLVRDSNPPDEFNDPIDHGIDREDCPRCGGEGSIICRCGGDLCVCMNGGEMPCPKCG